VSPDAWNAFYHTDLQGVWALWVVPLAFLVYLAVVRPDPARALDPMRTTFLWRYALFFTLETMIDPLAGGPIVRALGLADSAVATVVMVAFVLLGDFRVFLLVFALAAPARPLDRAGVLAAAGEAARWTLVVPVVALALDRVALPALVGPLPSQSIWLVYELCFLVLALLLRERLLPARLGLVHAGLLAYLRAILGYVALYYALWAGADILILAGHDLGWLVRIIPNQLYYALYVPTAYLLFFSPRYAETSTSIQTSR